jgi:hypothetical protein
VATAFYSFQEALFRHALSLVISLETNTVVQLLQLLHFGQNLREREREKEKEKERERDGEREKGQGGTEGGGGGRGGREREGMRNRIGAQNVGWINAFCNRMFVSAVRICVYQAFHFYVYVHGICYVITFARHAFVAVYICLEGAGGCCGCHIYISYIYIDIYIDIHIDIDIYHIIYIWGVLLGMSYIYMGRGGIRNVISNVT